MTDPRAGDVAEAERLLKQAQDSGAAPLPALSAGELWVLCGADQVLADENEAQWWEGLGEPRRKRLASAVLDFMTDRGLLGANGADQSAAPGQPLPLAPEVAMIVAARRYPAIVAVAVPPDGAKGPVPRMYGLADENSGLRAVVSEHVTSKNVQPFGPLHHFSLLSPERAGRVLALWTSETSAVRGRLLRRGRGQACAIDVFRHRDGELLTCDRLTVTAENGELLIVRHRPGAAPDPPVPCQETMLPGLITGMLTAEAQQ